ncbi:unnamed protein product [Sphagnum jensenii]|uniref:Secreted protein n=1 Tax=Sphagnum jensenii TaxID=128206 RepID=A0ABP1B6Z0_9BRYO
MTSSSATSHLSFLVFGILRTVALTIDVGCVKYHEQEDEATDGAPNQSKSQVWPLLSPVIKGWRGLAHYRTWTRRRILQKEYNLTLVHQFELPLIRNVKLQKII